MNSILNIFSWKRVNAITFVILLALMVLSFYGVYTNRFYFFKPDNFIIPVLAIVHMVYLYVIWFKIKEGELPDPKMRNLEYAVYALLAVYAFKIYDSVLIVNSYADFQKHVLPSMFRPMSILTSTLYCLLLPLTLLTIWYRKKLVGIYNFENYNNNLNVWQQ